MKQIITVTYEYERGDIYTMSEEKQKEWIIKTLSSLEILRTKERDLFWYDKLLARTDLLASTTFENLFF